MVRLSFYDMHRHFHLNVTRLGLRYDMAESKTRLRCKVNFLSLYNSLF